MTSEIDFDKAPGYCGICGPLSESAGRCELHDSRYGYDPASGLDQADEINYQLKGEGVEVASITDKQDTKNVRGDWFNPFGSDLAVRRLEAELNENARINIRLIEVVESSQEEADRLRNEIALLRLAARKPERHGAYLLTFPEYGPSAGMYLAMGVLLVVAGGLLSWLAA